MTPPKKKPKLFKKVPENARCCLDRSSHLSFREFIEKRDCLEQSPGSAAIWEHLKQIFQISGADYIRFWSAQLQSNTLLKTELGCSEIIDVVTEQRLKSLQTTATSSGDSSGNSSAPGDL